LEKYLEGFIVFFEFLYIRGGLKQLLLVELFFETDDFLKFKQHIVVIFSRILLKIKLWLPDNITGVWLNFTVNITGVWLNSTVNEVILRVRLLDLTEFFLE
jgi:hypothetical protein